MTNTAISPLVDSASVAQDARAATDSAADRVTLSDIARVAEALGVRTSDLAALYVRPAPRPATRLETCPEWCDYDHRDKAPYDDPADACHFVKVAKRDGFGVDVGFSPREGFLVHLDAGDSLTTSEARAVASALLVAAETVEVLANVCH